MPHPLCPCPWTLAPWGKTGAYPSTRAYSNTCHWAVLRKATSPEECSLPRQPHVLIVTNWFPSRSYPAEGTFVLDWARVADRVARVEVLHLSKGGPGTLERDDNSSRIPVYRLPIAWEGAREPIKYIKDVRAAAATIARLHRRDPVDLVHAHSYRAATAARFTLLSHRIPYMVTEHFSRLLSNDLRWHHRQEIRFALSSANAITVVGPSLGAAVGRIADRPVRVIPNPVPATFAVAPALDPSPPYRLVSVGRLERVKGFDVGLEALAMVGKHVDAQWVIAGDGPERNALQCRARVLGIRDRVKFVGRIPREQVGGLMATSHAVMIPSRLETFSVVAAEAMMCGRPVITTRCGGPEAFVGPEQGRVVLRDNPRELAGALEEVLLHLSEFPPAELHRAAAERFSVDEVARQLRDVYAGVLG